MPPLSSTCTAKNILVIRRDNIGDLVCTLPMLSSLRRQCPDAWIGVLCNSYNVAVLAGNSDIDAVFAYRKAKHRPPGTSRLTIWLETAGLLWRLRRRSIDLAIVASPGGERFARLVGAKQIVADKQAPGHEAEACLDLLRPLGLSAEPGPFSPVRPDHARRAALAARLETRPGPVVGIHLSARRPSQRWPAERFAALARRLVASGKAGQVLLFWAPGAADDPQHPGDDDKAKEVLSALHGLPVIAMPTRTLEDLIAGLDLCDRVICADGGAMHLAAGLGKPIVCLFGDSSTTRWHPWGVHYELLQAPSQDVRDLSVEQVSSAYDRLTADPGFMANG